MNRRSTFRPIASTAGRRSARLPGGHGKNMARKSTGVEGALVVRRPIEISSLDTGDSGSDVVRTGALCGQRSDER